MICKIWEDKGHINKQPHGKENSQASATKKRFEKKEIKHTIFSQNW